MPGSPNGTPINAEIPPFFATRSRPTPPLSKKEGELDTAAGAARRCGRVVVVVRGVGQESGKQP